MNTTKSKAAYNFKKESNILAIKFPEFLANDLGQ